MGVNLLSMNSSVAVISIIDNRFSKAFPKKISKIGKWAYVSPASGSAKAAPKIKVRVDEEIDKELNLYKYYDEKGNAGCAAGSIIEWISLIGKKITLKGDLPKNIKHRSL